MSNYGTAPPATTRPNQPKSRMNQQHDHNDRETTRPLLPSTSSSSSGSHPSHSPLQRLKYHLTRKVSKTHTDLLLLLCYIVTGLLDSSATAIWGSFVSMQTGNTIYLGLGLGNLGDSTRWIKSLVSIASFCLGSVFFSRYHRYFEARKRWVLMLSFTLQMGLVAGAAVITMLTPNVTKKMDVDVDVKSKEEHDLHWHVLLPLMMVAFQSSGQAITSRVVSFNSLTSVVLTSIYCDLFADPKLLVGITKNAERNRRMAAPLCLLAGAVLGGFYSRQGQWGIAGALWTAVVLKAVIIFMWFIWRNDEEEED